MTDLFEEVEEQLRTDRYKQLGRRVLPWMAGIAGAALIGALGYWGFDSWRTTQISEASERYASAIDAFAGGDREGARKLWTEVSQSRAPAYKALSLMHLGAYSLNANNITEAVRQFDAAAEAAPDPLIGDAARLKSAFALLDTASFSAMEARLKPLMEEGRPYRLQAREALAYAKLNAGDLKGARGDFVLLTQALDAGDGLQSRARAAMGLIDSGTAKALPQVVKAAAALPPPMMMPPGAQPIPPQAGAPQ